MQGANQGTHGGVSLRSKKHLEKVISQKFWGLSV